MSIKSALKALFHKDEPAAPMAVLEQTVADISKDLVGTIAKLDDRSKALAGKISAAEAAIAAANEAKKNAFAEQTDAYALSKKIQEIVGSVPASKPAAATPPPEVVAATGGRKESHASRNGVA